MSTSYTTITFFDKSKTTIFAYKTYSFSERQWKTVKDAWNRSKKQNLKLSLYDVAYDFAITHKVLEGTPKGGAKNAKTVEVSFDKFDQSQGFMYGTMATNQQLNNIINKAIWHSNATTYVSAATANVSRADMKTNCKWNLPPHAWSLPYVDTDVYGTTVDHQSRRGKIFYYTFNPQDQSATTLTQDPTTGKPTQTQTKYTSGDARKYGFQFMWNPDTYTTSTTLQPDVTPSKDDIWVSGAGMFPGVETISFNVRLDRTNDFACFKSLYPNGVSTLSESAKKQYLSAYYPTAVPNEFERFVDSASGTRKSKLDWLMKYGTLADLEYLYRVFTDINIINKPLGDNFVTADVGFIGFFIVCIEVGPMYYLGYVTGISVNHLAFTEDYIPIRTDVTITANIMANGSDTVGASTGSLTYSSTSDSTPVVASRAAISAWNDFLNQNALFVSDTVQNLGTNVVKKSVTYPTWAGNPSWGGADPR